MTMIRIRRNTTVKEPTYEDIPSEFPHPRNAPETWKILPDYTIHKEDDKDCLRTVYYNNVGESPIALRVRKYNDCIYMKMELLNNGSTDRLPNIVVEKGKRMPLVKRAEIVMLGLMYDWKDGFDPISWY